MPFARLIAPQELLRSSSVPYGSSSKTMPVTRTSTKAPRHLIAQSKPDTPTIDSVSTPPKKPSPQVVHGVAVIVEDRRSAVVAGKEDFGDTECLLNRQSGLRLRKMQRGRRHMPTRGTQSIIPGQCEPTIAKTLKRKRVSSRNNSMGWQGRGSIRCLNGAQLFKDQNKGSVSQHLIKDENSEAFSEVDDFKIETASECRSAADQQVVFDPFGDADPLSISFGSLDNRPAAFAEAQASPLSLTNIGGEDLGEDFRRSYRATSTPRVPKGLGATSLVGPMETSNPAIPATLLCDLHASHLHKVKCLLQKKEESLKQIKNSYRSIASRISPSESLHSANQQIVSKTEGVVTRWQRRLDAMSQWNPVFEKAESDPDDENVLISAIDIVVPKLQKATREALAAKEEYAQSTSELENLRQQLQKVEKRRLVLEVEVQKMRAYCEALKKMKS